ncbi:MAG: hypothetical protein IJX35_01865 [Candidatus Methanomethylophilaceae archaeon]|nr:hypothetical protein [Candidatus Methanomethylophilaceae archaeon]
MALNDTVKDKMKSDMSLTERIALYIPGYRGYREKNLRREQDRAVRNELSRAIQGTKADLATIQRDLISQPNLMLDVERIRTKVDRYDVDVRKAVNGYSAFHDAVKILEDDLDRLVKWDAQLVDDIQLMRQATSDLLRSVDDADEVKAEIRNLERGIDGLIEAYLQRESVMRGFENKE